jgi:hypothetical protein
MRDKWTPRFGTITSYTRVIEVLWCSELSRQGYLLSLDTPCLPIVVTVSPWMTNHDSGRATRLHDCRNDQVGLDEVERILI